MSFGIKRRHALGLTAAAFALPSAAFAETTLTKLRKRGFIRVAVANEVPYGYMDADGHAKGIGPDVAKHVLTSIGIKHIEWVVMPFGELIPGLRARRVDMVAAEQNILPARCQVVDFSVPDSSYGEGLLVKAGNPHNIHSYMDIKNNPKLKLAIVSGADELAIAHGLGIPDSQIVSIDANADALSSVSSGRVAAYGATELTVARLAKHSQAVEAATPFTQPIVNGKSVRSYGGFSFRKDETSLREAFDKSLTAFKATDGWAKILRDAGLSDASIKAAQQKTTPELCAG
ncbi:ectoine/hydroxyectoine ABC transporter substrate-binding protein EhuB [Acidocella aminolytica]|jgi:polar amino acid transport system substrate-binding protein|uniref:ABC transporter ectoine/hydroxyectoine permease n=1 Tax=Acidocella aminolytica 101 = DSM 11237 TaxID=1120923 RepID=A0A0D6PAQ1_9PROT|nr:ectoine/hydroxyectoine ABC transporter substrate-binding protein EhuB [Acidocella aminolytica]GAN78830.1 ABC transporter ectoine/hydroxyectoine permease [Acidocella aminolytica 101 = DSM 11237]GBQ33266.1 amino acid ABC transporter substrate-binding periplasmic protein [Acidocella aminolytica 101 = DSM 11237]SHF17614.1 polar amino acid transport system substrate-binding protein [Acidocella aminolytica 101 = DSM 11237]